jgi:hypothetical protein
VLWRKFGFNDDKGWQAGMQRRDRKGRRYLQNPSYEIDEKDERKKGGIRGNKQTLQSREVPRRGVKKCSAKY